MGIHSAYINCCIKLLRCSLLSCRLSKNANFGLCGGQEHSQLQWNPLQITVVEGTRQRNHLLYVDNVSIACKNNRGGLRMHKVEAKRVIQYQPSETRQMHCENVSRV